MESIQIDQLNHISHLSIPLPLSLLPSFPLSPFPPLLSSTSLSFPLPLSLSLSLQPSLSLCCSNSVISYAM